MKKNYLKNKIFKKIYFWELKKTTIDQFLKITALLILGLLFLIFTQVFFEILNEQKTFDLLNFYGEDFEVIKRYFLDNFFVFWLEIPKYLLFIILLLFLLLIYIILTFIKNWSTIKNKVKSFINFLKKT